MKKALLVPALLAASISTAWAQSSVTLTGVVDLSVRYNKYGNVNMTGVGTDGFVGSRLVFRANEDLGGGLRAGAWLESGIAPDTGAQVAAQFFNRAAYAYIGGESLGDIRIGRDYTPSFWSVLIYDPWSFSAGAVGSGAALFAALNPAAPTSVIPTFARADNSVSYTLPAGLGGLYGQAMVAAGEGNPSMKYTGARLGYAAGKLNVGASYAQDAAQPDHIKVYNIGASYDFGMAKLMGYYLVGEAGNAKRTNYSVGATVPLGLGFVRASYIHSDASGTLSGALAGTASPVNVANVDADQFAIGYVYHMSKRTSLYTNLAFIDNDSLSRVRTSSNPNLAVANRPFGEKATGFEVGISHRF